MSPATWTDRFADPELWYAIGYLVGAIATLLVAAKSAGMITKRRRGDDDDEGEA